VVCKRKQTTTSKSLLITLLASLGVVFSLSAQEDHVMAKVDLIDGKQVYVLNEPVRSYESVGQIRTGLKFFSLITRGIVNEDIADKTVQYTRKAIRKFDRKEIEFDAIIYSEGRKVDVVYFTSDLDVDQDRLAKVSEVNGVNAFVLAEPLFDFERDEDVLRLFQPRSFFTYGLWNNSIEQDAKRFVKKQERKFKMQDSSLTIQDKE
jgi:hypothetical protein